MGVATRCGCKEVYIDFLVLLIPTPLVSVPFYSSIPTFCSYIYTIKSGIYAHALITVNGKGLCAYKVDMRL